MHHVLVILTHIQHTEGSSHFKCCDPGNIHIDALTWTLSPPNLFDTDIGGGQGPCAGVWHPHAHMHMRRAVLTRHTCTHVHVQRYRAGGHGGSACGSAEDLSPRPGPAKAIDWHRATDRELGTPALTY